MGLIDELFLKSVVLSIEDGQLIYRAPIGVVDDDMLQRMRADKQALSAAVEANVASQVDRVGTCRSCGRVVLLDDARGFRCNECGQLAWLFKNKTIVRADFEGIEIDEMPPGVIPVAAKP